MIRCTEVSQQLPEYVRGRLNPEQCSAIADHLAGCRACAEELADLQRIAQAVERHGAVLFEDHLEAQMLVAYAGEPETMDAHQRQNVERHLELCDSCHREYEILLRVNEDLLTGEAWVASETLLDRAESVSHKETIKLPAWLTSRLGCPAQRWWRPLALAATVLVMIGSLWTVYYVRKQPPTDSLRGGRDTSVIEARAPLGLITEPPKAFVWEPVQGAKAYRVALYNSVLEKLWQSTEMTTHSLELPPDVVSQLRPGQRYFWQVTVTLERHKMVKSRVYEFTLAQRSEGRAN